jgi:uncharacterized protein with GYD domain
MIERLGGKLEGYWIAFGDYDSVVIAQVPDNICAAALSLAASAGGALKSIKTTPGAGLLVVPPAGATQTVRR